MKEEMLLEIYKEVSELKEKCLKVGFRLDNIELISNDTQNIIIQAQLNGVKINIKYANN